MLHMTSERNLFHLGNDLSFGLGDNNSFRLYGALPARAALGRVHSPLIRRPIMTHLAASFAYIAVGLLVWLMRPDPSRAESDVLMS
jgi:hypothetical protein